MRIAKIRWHNVGRAGQWSLQHAQLAIYSSLGHFCFIPGCMLACVAPYTPAWLSFAQPQLLHVVVPCCTLCTTAELPVRAECWAPDKLQQLCMTGILWGVRQELH